MAEERAKVGIYTLGCKVNQYESEAMAEFLQSHGIDVVSPSELCDAYIINTCTVTAESDRKARQFIRRAINRNPSALIAVTGCLAESSPQELKKIAGIDIIVGNAKKLLTVEKLLELLGDKQKLPSPMIFSEDIDSSPFEEMSIKHFDRTRAYIKIEDGCENRCTYCIIPSARGKVRSKLPCKVIEEVRTLTEGGCREIVLTGIETASYGKDLGNVNLGDILEEVDKIEGVGRIRLGSLDPSLITPEFAARLSKLKNLAPHFHLSLQSGSDRILALMKRKYNSRMAMNAIELLRKNIPDVKFTTDIIVGFPGETEEDFRATVEFVEKAHFLMAHIFPYSKRKGTLAANMQEQLPEEIKKERLHTLSSVAEKTRMEILKKKSECPSPIPVLFETFKDGKAFGHTSDFIEVAVPSEKPLRSETLYVSLTHTDGNICYGQLYLDKKESII
ncbi:MAG: tRNA (N(6)-L-threonylcarbamoyladenosine(37)-C(2))-methylthiotransferase MtaB [Clostridia bacterium]|nr:tRNA (N(6)-L-threonylcarbamoyladenosine(37)-C(2))-methylthiotransferase MtaB [Clostridia bacterium]